MFFTGLQRQVLFSFKKCSMKIYREFQWFSEQNQILFQNIYGSVQGLSQDTSQPCQLVVHLILTDDNSCSHLINTTFIGNYQYWGHLEIHGVVTWYWYHDLRSSQFKSQIVYHHRRFIFRAGNKHSIFSVILQKRYVRNVHANLFHAFYITIVKVNSFFFEKIALYIKTLIFIFLQMRIGSD